MRELTGKELDAVCGGLLNFAWGDVKQKIYNPQTNYIGDTKQKGFVNVYVPVQTNYSNNYNI